MRIVVLVKHVPDALDGLPYGPDLTVDREAIRGALGEIDAYALELAVGIARRRIDVQVSALTMGPSSAITCLRAALALGADDGVHVVDAALHGSDALATSRVLAAAIRKMGADLVLCGAASADSGMAVIPVMVAERLGMPAICHADTVRAEDEDIIGVCDDGESVAELACGLPVLVSVVERHPHPRHPSFPAVAEARNKLVRTWSLEDLAIGSADVGLGAAATVMRAVIDHRAARRTVIGGADPRVAARLLVDFLSERHFV